MMLRRMSLALTLIGAIAACKAADKAPAPATTPDAFVAEGDSAIPRVDALRRFQTNLLPPEQLGGGFADRDSLVRFVFAAVQRGDTAALARVSISRAEFAFLYYPTTPRGLPPYSLGPGALWFFTDGHSQNGKARLLRAHAGTSLRFVSYACKGEPSLEGGNTVWGPCAVTYVTAKGDTTTERFANQILLRDGQYKVLAYADESG